MSLMLRKGEPFSVNFIEKFPAARSLSMLESWNAIFISIPRSKTCSQTSLLNGGLPSYLVEVVCFSEKALSLVTEGVEKNPLFSEDVLPRGYSLFPDFVPVKRFLVTNFLSYEEFVSLIEVLIEALEKNEASVKRFENCLDFQSRKMRFNALDKEDTFYNFLEGAALDSAFDSSLTKYCQEIFLERQKDS